MTLQLAEDGIEIEGYHANNDADGDPDYVIGPDEAGPLEISARLQDLKDEASIQAFGNYLPARSGDRLRVLVEPEGVVTSEDDSLETTEEWTDLEHRWTGMVRDVEEEILAYDPEDGVAGRRSTSIDAEDYVFTLLSWRNIYRVFTDTEIAGHEGAIIETLLESQVADEDRISYEEIDPVDQTTDAFFDGTTLLEAVKELRDRANAITAAEDDALVFRPLSNLEVKHHLTLADVELPITRSSEDDELKNQIRVDGATAVELEASEAQETVVDTRVVTDEEPALYQLSTRKSELSRIEVWTDPSSYDGNLNVRIQKANSEGDAPIAIDDDASDVASHQLSYEFLADEGFTQFDIPEHTLPDTTDFYLIIESGDDQQIGVDGDNVPAVRPYFGYPIASRGSDWTSVTRHRRRDERIRKDNVDTSQAAQDRVNAALRRDTTPRNTLNVSAHSERAHMLKPGEVVALNFDVDGWPAENYIVLERDDSYANLLLQTELELAPLDQFQ